MKTKNLLALSVAATFVAPTAVFAQDSADEDAHHELDQIVVTATPLARTVEELALSTSVLFGDELAKKQSTSIGETLSHEVGLSSTYFGPISSRPVIRGQYGERVGVLTNGLDTLDASALSEDHQSTVESLLARRIEIIRGPATLLYGSGTAGGLINVVDTRFAEGPQDEPIQGAVAVGADSAVGNRDAAVRASFGGDNVVFNADYFVRSTDDIEIPGFAESAILRASEEEEDHGDGDGDGHDEEEEEAFGKVENTDSETQGGAVGMSFLTGNGVLGLSFSGFNSEYGIPGHEHHHEEDGDGGMLPGMVEEEEEESVRIDLEQRRVDAMADLDFDGFISGLKFRAAVNDYEHKELEGDEIGTAYDVHGFDGRIELQHAPIAGALEGAVGVQYKLVEFDAVGEEAFVPPSDTEQVSLFIYEEWQLTEAFVLQGSARLEEQSIQGPTIAENYDDSAVGASVGGVWRLSDGLRLSANVALTERHPTSTELYSNGPHLAVQRYERGSVALGNGILDKETSTNFDVTLHGDGDRLEWSITGFINSVDDYILLRPTTEEIDELVVYDYDQADVEFVGLEAEAMVEIMDDGNNHWHVRLFTDYVVAEEDSTGANLPRIPPQRFGLGLHGGWNQFDASIDAIFASEQDDVAENELPTASYTSLDLSLGYAFADSDLYMFLRGTNLLDEDIRQHSSPLKDLVPLPGRSIHFGLRYDF